MKRKIKGKHLIGVLFGRPLSWAKGRPAFALVWRQDKVLAPSLRREFDLEGLFQCFPELLTFALMNYSLFGCQFLVNKVPGGHQVSPRFANSPAETSFELAAGVRKDCS